METNNQASSFLFPSGYSEVGRRGYVKGAVFVATNPSDLLAQFLDFFFQVLLLSFVEFDDVHGIRVRCTLVPPLKDLLEKASIRLSRLPFFLLMITETLLERCNLILFFL